MSIRRYVANIYTFCLLNADQIGLTPDEVISKIMANPDVAMAFQNPRVQAAILDVSNFFNSHPIYLNAPPSHRTLLCYVALLCVSASIFDFPHSCSALRTL